MIPIGTLAAITSVILWVSASTTAKKLSRDLGSHLVSFLYVILSLIPIFIITYAVGVFSMPLYGLIITFIAGIFLAIGFISGFQALQTEHLASVSAIGEITPAILVIFGLLVLGEQATFAQIASIVVIFSGAAMIITNEKFEVNKRLFPALISILAWTAYWIALTYAVRNSGTFVLPVLISRIVGLPFIILYLMRSKNSVQSLRNLPSSLKKNKKFANLLGLTVFASFADAVGDSIFGITVGSSVLAIGSALIALQPMMVSFLGFLLYKERLTRLQFFGLAVMIIGAIALSMV